MVATCQGNRECTANGRLRGRPLQPAQAADCDSIGDGHALVLGLLTVLGVVQLWHVYVLAFLFGCAAAFDAPVRQTFVAELVGDNDLPNAIALNSTSFNAARMIGPAVTGLVIAGIGTGWAFLFNGVSFVAVLISLCVLHRSELQRHDCADRRGVVVRELSQYEPILGRALHPRSHVGD